MRNNRKRSLQISIAPSFVLVMFVLLASCGTMGIRGIRPLLSKTDASIGFKTNSEKQQDRNEEAISLPARHFADENTAGAKVLTAALDMLDKKTIVVGSCWDYVDKVYTNAGFTADKRVTVFSSKETGPYADPLLLVPGDWIMFKNLTFGNIGHSAIFAGWLDAEKRSAITIEYAGQNRQDPGRYREYDLTKCYGVLRAKE